LPKTKVNDIEVYYEKQGKGQKLVYLCGTGSDLRNKPNIFDTPLSKRFTILAYDQRGMGQTDKPDIPYTMAIYADDASELMNTLGWKKAHVLGVSFGGMVAQELALRHPQKVNKLVLACTSSGGAGGSSYPFYMISHLSAEERARTLIPIMDTRHGEEWRRLNPERYEAVMRSWLEPSKFVGEPGRDVGSRRQLEARRDHDTNDRLHLLNMPVYICGGRYDGNSSPENLKTLHEAIHGSRLEFFEGGHGFLGQDPAAYERIAEFLLKR
jgi:3-oxoadipate enol-lactonase